MTFTQIDDTWTDSPAVLNVSRSARHLMTEGYVYCNRQLTDGFITRAQWLRSTDSEDFDAELGALIREGLVRQVNGGYLLDWSKQQSREQVERGRERRRVDNERRTKSLALHKEGDHSLCTHEGGDLHRGRSGGQASKGQSRGRSGGSSNAVRASSGRSTGQVPSHPIPSRNGVEGGMGNAGAGGAPLGGPIGPASAGATASPGRRAVAEVDADTLEEIRDMRSRFTAEWLGTDPAALSDEQLVHFVYARTRRLDLEDGVTPQSFQRWARESGLNPDAFADPADGLGGLIQGGASGAARQRAS